MKIEIKNTNGDEIFSHDIENNTVKETIREAINQMIDLRNSNLRGSNLRNSDLRNSDLRSADLSGSNLIGSNLIGSNLSYSNLSYSDLRSADLSGSNLIGSNLSYSNLSYSNLRNSDLRYSDLRYSDLSYSDLSGTKLNNCMGNMVEICSMQIETYMIVFTKDRLFIGCEEHLIDEWKQFSDEEIKKMDSKALEFWKKYKDFIFNAIALRGF